MRISLTLLYKNTISGVMVGTWVILVEVLRTTLGNVLLSSVA